MNKAIIVDIDGTLSNNNHRQHFIAGDKKDWKSFSAGCVDDTINEWCRVLIESIAHKHASVYEAFKVIYVSGRTEEFRGVTQDFITYHINMSVLPFITHTLHMRKDGDYRADTIIKEEIYNEHIRNKYDVLFCVDDRPSVCRMWRSLGLTVLQCNDVEF